MITKKAFFTIVVVVLAIVLIAVLLWFFHKDKEQPEDPDSYDDQTTDTGTLTGQEPDETEQDWVTLPDGPVREVPDLDDGNEDYLDMDVVSKLEKMAENDEADQVDAILDGLILLINHFVKEDYSYQAICQVQRFYFEFYYKLTDTPIDTVIEKLTECISTEGAITDGFSARIEKVFGWEAGEDFSYMFEMEDRK